MEECPNCKKWTLSYDPKAEMSTCLVCGFKQSLAYNIFIEQKNVINNLSYPRKEGLVKKEQIVCIAKTQMPCVKTSVKLP